MWEHRRHSKDVNNQEEVMIMEESGRLNSGKNGMTGLEPMEERYTP